MLRLGVVVMVMSVACGRGPVEQPRPGPTTEAAYRTPGPDDCVADTTGPASINAMATSDAAVIGRVVEISAPKWNSVSGEPFTYSEQKNSIRVHPQRYRYATVRVSRVLWSSERIRVSAGEDLVVRVVGDGTHSGCEIGRTRENDAAGPVEVGWDVLWVLSVRPLYLYDPGRLYRTEEQVTLDWWSANWHLVDGRALSLDPRRSAPADRLVARLLEERKRGYRPADERGKVDPLER